MIIGGRRSLVVIENKVRPDSGVFAQIEGYCQELQRQGKHVIPVVFHSYPGRINSEKSTQTVECLELCLDKMVELLSATVSTQSDSILGEFLRHLQGKIDRARHTSEVIKRGGADPEMWMEIARTNNVEDLFASYLQSAEATGGRPVFNNGISVATHYSSDPSKKGSPVFSLHLKKSSQERGLRIGYNDTNYSKAFSIPFPTSCLPVDFADDPHPGQSGWHFGFFRNSTELGTLFCSIE